jgi:hypothetical protein
MLPLTFRYLNDCTGWSSEATSLVTAMETTIPLLGVIAGVVTRAEEQFQCLLVNKITNIYTRESAAHTWCMCLCVVVSFIQQ